MKKTKIPAQPSLPLPIPVTVDLGPVDYAGDATLDDISRLMAPSKPVNKPDISRLPDALADGFPVFGPGDSIVIERYTAFLKGKPYLDTKTFRVVDVDSFTGRLKLYDESLQQYAADNWKTGLLAGNVYKMAMGHAVSTKKKRGRPRKEVIGEVKAPVDPNAPKRGRGRPKGAKNRSKDEIKAEKDAKKAERAARKAAR